MYSLFSIDLLPYVFLFIMGVSALLITAVSRIVKTNHVYYFVQFALIAAAYLFWQTGHIGVSNIVAHSNKLLFNPLIMISNIFICLYTMVVLIYTKANAGMKEIASNEYYTLILFAVLGMTIMVSAVSLLLLYLGLELLSLSSYILVAMHRRNHYAIEAALKYFIMGSIASGILLYGISMLFGATKTLNINSIAHYIHVYSMQDHHILIVGLVFLLVGIAFKLGAAPFQMWVPDVYQGARTPATLFLATTPKIAIFLLAIHLFPQALNAIHSIWQHLFEVLACLSLAIGNIAALRQTSIKRLLAYSSISHMGYILLAFSCDTHSGFSSAMFYLITYILMTLVAFGSLALLSNASGEIDDIESLRGFSDRRPWVAFVMLLNFFSMAGLPPLVGFMAKLGIIESLIRLNQTFFAVYAIIFSVIGAYYYIRVVMIMYFHRPAAEADSIKVSSSGRLTLSINALLIALLGIFPGGLFHLCHQLNFFVG